MRSGIDNTVQALRPERSNFKSDVIAGLIGVMPMLGQPTETLSQTICTATRIMLELMLNASLRISHANCTDKRALQAFLLLWRWG